MKIEIRQKLVTTLLLGVLTLFWGASAFAQHYSHTYRYTGDVETRPPTGYLSGRCPSCPIIA